MTLTLTTENLQALDCLTHCIRNADKKNATLTKETALKRALPFGVSLAQLGKNVEFSCDGKPFDFAMTVALRDGLAAVPTMHLPGRNSAKQLPIPDEMQAPIAILSAEMNVEPATFIQLCLQSAQQWVEQKAAGRSIAKDGQNIMARLTAAPKPKPKVGQVVRANEPLGMSRQDVSWAQGGGRSS